MSNIVSSLRLLRCSVMPWTNISKFLCLSVLVVVIFVDVGDRSSVYGLEGVSAGLGVFSVGSGGGGPPSLSIANTSVSLLYPNSEVVLSLIPGIFYAWRSEISKAYVSLGGGIMLDRYGLAVGATIGFGTYLFCLWICVGLEYRQAIGMSPFEIITKNRHLRIASPYAIRLQVTVF